MLKVSTPDGKLTRLVETSQRQEYLDKGWIIEDTSEVEMMLDEDGNTLWRYKEDTEWNTIAGGSGTDTYKVKVDGTDTAEYLENKLEQGTNVTITKADGKLIINSTGNGDSGVTVYADLAAIKAVDTTALTSGTLAQVVTLGQFVFNSTSTMTGDDVNVITPTTGGGRWILQTFAIEEVPTSTGATWSTNTKNPTINNRIIKTTKKDATKVRVVAIGSSVMIGQELANPATENYIALLATDLGANYTFFNNSIGGNTTALGYARFDKDVVGFNPDIVIMGFSPNNNALAEASTQGGCDSAVFSYLKYLLLMIRECENRGYDYIIMGVYPKNSYTAIANKALKSLNIKLSEMFGAKYINILGQLEDGASKIRSGFYTADGIHFTSTAHIYIKNCIPYNLFDYLSKTKNKFELNKENGLNLGSDVVTAYPLKTNSNSQLGRIRSWSVGVDVNLKGNSITGKTLILFESSDNTASVKLIVNSNDYLEFQYKSNSVLTTAIKLKSTGWNRIVVVFDKPSQRFKLYVDGVYIGQTSLIDFNHQYVVLGGDSVATNNCVNAEFRNLSRWILPLTSEEVVADFNKILIYGGLDEFYPLKDLRSCYVNLAINSNMILDLNTTTASLSNETDNNFTDAEKQKVTALNTVGAAVASATSITAPSTVFHVTGTTAISTITVPYTGFTGKISIIPDGIFTFDTAGNIAEAYTATVNRAIDLVYDGAKWYRV